MPCKAVTIAVFFCLFGICIEKSHATIIVSGDVSMAAFLNSAYSINNPGNQHFFDNILQNSDNVAVVKQTTLDNFNSTYAVKIKFFYDTYSKKDAKSDLITTITMQSIENINMLIIPVPQIDFSGEELICMNDYINNGGSIFFLGENAGYSINNSIINHALATIGSSLSIVDNSLDTRVTKITNLAQINQNDAFTENVSSFTYGSVSAVEGGISLFTTKNMTTFVAYENISVPEPPMAWLIVAGMLGMLGLATRINRN
jgi:hypothetical protein